MKLARWIFLAAAIYGVLVLAPGFFAELGSGAAIASPEWYYGFYGSALVWQIAFFVIASDPARFRLLMPVCVLEKLAFFATSIALAAAGRMELGGPFIGGMIDGVWMILFAIAWRATKPA